MIKKSSKIYSIFKVISVNMCRFKMCSCNLYNVKSYTINYSLKMAKLCKPINIYIHIQSQLLGWVWWSGNENMKLSKEELDRIWQNVTSSQLREREILRVDFSLCS